MIGDSIYSVQCVSVDSASNDAAAIFCRSLATDELPVMPHTGSPTAHQKLTQLTMSTDGPSVSEMLAREGQLSARAREGRQQAEVALAEERQRQHQALAELQRLKAAQNSTQSRPAGEHLSYGPNI